VEALSIAKFREASLEHQGRHSRSRSVQHKGQSSFRHPFRSLSRRRSPSPCSAAGILSVVTTALPSQWMAEAVSAHTFEDPEVLKPLRVALEVDISRATSDISAKEDLLHLSWTIEEDLRHFSEPNVIIECLGNIAKVWSEIKADLQQVTNKLRYNIGYPSDILMKSIVRLKQKCSEIHDILQRYPSEAILDSCSP